MPTPKSNRRAAASTATDVFDRFPLPWKADGDGDGDVVIKASNGATVSIMNDMPLAEKVCQQMNSAVASVEQRATKLLEEIDSGKIGPAPENEPLTKASVEEKMRQQMKQRLEESA
jgi:hypothetical protein